MGDDFHEDFEVVFMMIVCVIKWFLDLRHPKRLCKNQQITTNMMISRIFFDDFPWKIDQNHGKWRKTWKCEEHDDFWDNFMMILGSFPAERRFLG